MLKELCFISRRHFRMIGIVFALACATGESFVFAQNSGELLGLQPTGHCCGVTPGCTKACEDLELVLAGGWISVKTDTPVSYLTCVESSDTRFSGVACSPPQALRWGRLHTYTGKGCLVEHEENPGTDTADTASNGCGSGNTECAQSA